VGRNEARDAPAPSQLTCLSAPGELLVFLA
jgi:hypothetical protein